jgi:hypothetical protein
MATPLLAGRAFTDADRGDGRRAAIVNEAFARRFLNSANPVGYAINGLGPDEIPIVGMAGDAVYRRLRDPVPPTVYLPFAESREAALFGMALSVRSRSGSAESLIRSVSPALQAVNRDLMWSFRSLADQIDGSIVQERLTAMLSGFFGVLALLLAALGLYGVTSYAVTRRRVELGIRMALGAAPDQVVRLVISRVGVLVMAGVAIGGVTSFWASTFVAPLLFGLEPRDPATFLSAALILAAVAAMAAWLPAWRASRIDPAVVLRNE